MERFTDEQQLVVDSFQNGFEGFKNKNIVLYGIGKNTDAILRGCKGFNIVGLMDSKTEGEVLYGLPVLGTDAVKSIENAIIVIVARQSVVDIIYKRIEFLWSDNAIAIYDYSGVDLTKQSQTYRNQDLPYWKEKLENLYSQIDAHEVISFDIFDTLMMRRVLEPTDVFDIVQAQLKKHFGDEYEESFDEDSSFSLLRKQAEKQAGYYASLDEIYEKLQELIKESAFKDKTTEVLEYAKKLELECEKQQLFARPQMLAAYNYAISKGKEVYLLSDMYLPSSFLRKVLEVNGFSDYKDLFVSCEIKRQKEDGSAYQWYLERINHQLSEDRRKCLHIGDNRYVDIQRAKEAGIDTYQVYSAYELLMASSLQSVVANCNTLYKRNMLGLFVARAFANPFILGKTNGYLAIDKAIELGYLFIAPLLMQLVMWLDNLVKETNTKKLLLPSRDGYLIQQLYEVFAESPVKNVYFRTSRRAVTVASIETRADIDKIAEREFQGNNKEFLHVRYGVDADAMVNRKSLLDRFEQKIIQEARKEKIAYLKYLRKLGIESKDSLLFDFVASGTVQHYLSKLCGEEFQGAYMATMNLPNAMYEKDTDKIYSAMGNITSYGSQSALAKYYLFVEAILIDDKMSFSHIDEEGNEVFEPNSSMSNYEEIESLQAGIIEYARDYKAYFGDLNFQFMPHIDTELKEMLTYADEVFGTMFSESVQVDAAVKAVFKNDDFYDGVGQYRIWK